MRSFLFAIPLFLATALPALGAGLLTPVDSAQAPLEIRTHHADVVINNGFARTEVTQTFFNPNSVDLEALYSFPLPEHASLAEVSITSGEMEIHGEVLPREEARRAYEEEKKKGNDAGLAEKQGYQSFDFSVSPVRAQSETRVRFVYYQPVSIDTGIGRYLYPLEAGGTDEAGQGFWLPNTKVEQSFSVAVELKSSYPVADVRAPGFENDVQVERLDAGHFRIRLDRGSAHLDRDFLLYYRLAEDLPGRIDLIPYRADSSKPGTFMLVVTPGIDLQPIDRGSDYSFVLDVSGSMQTKIHTLANGVARAMGELSPEDRFRIVVFDNRARDLTGWLAATPQHVERALERIQSLAAGGSTNLFAGITEGLSSLDDDRATSLVLVTDAVTNTGVIDPVSFHRLMKEYDVRVFGFLLGNSGNWPLLRTIADASGGFYAPVSNSDDILGPLLQAQSKITHEALHHAELKIKKVKTFDTTGDILPKVYRGQQLVIFGRYEGGGRAKVSLEANLTGEDQVYETTFDFPEIDMTHPEVERLWALARAEQIELQSYAGIIPHGEAKEAIKDLGVTYQIVTDETSMVVLTEQAFAERGIERRNQARVATENQARQQRAVSPPRATRADEQQPMFKQRAPRVGGGAIDPLTALLALGGVSLTAFAARRRGRRESAA